MMKRKNYMAPMVLTVELTQRYHLLEGSNPVGIQSSLGDPQEPEEEEWSDD